MIVGDIIKELTRCPDYRAFRITVNDETIQFIKDALPSSYDLFADREIKYIELKELDNE